jgi:hypothetical protein
MGGGAIGGLWISLNLPAMRAAASLGMPHQEGGRDDFHGDESQNARLFSQHPRPRPLRLTANLRLSGVVAIFPVKGDAGVAQNEPDQIGEARF